MRIADYQCPLATLERRVNELDVGIFRVETVSHANRRIRHTDISTIDTELANSSVISIQGHVFVM